MMKLTISLEAKENEHQNFIEALEAIVDDIKGGFEKSKYEDGDVNGEWSIDPVL